MKAQRQIIRAIVMAQIASDAGKGTYELHMKADRGARHLGYGLKVTAIVRALRMIDTTPMCGVNYYVEKTLDQNRCASTIVYFDVKVHDGVRKQLSFHTPMSLADPLQPWVGKGRKTRWTREFGGSRKAARELIELFDL